MKKNLQTLAIVTCLLATVATIYLNARSYKIFFTNFSDYLSFSNLIGLIPQLVGMLLILFNIVLGIMALTANGHRQDWAYKLLRYFTVMTFLMYLPLSLYVQFTSARYFAMAGTSFLVAFWAARLLTLASVVLFLIVKPQSQPAAIDLSEYELVEYTSTGHRFVHYLVDTLYVLPMFAATYSIVSYNMGENFLVRNVVYIFCCFLYAFLSETIFRQTLGKIMTRSCVAGIGYKPTAGRILLRTLGRWIPFDPFSFLSGRNWHDSTTSTTVVYVDSWEKAFTEADHDREDWLTAK